MLMEKNIIGRKYTWKYFRDEVLGTYFQMIQENKGLHNVLKVFKFEIVKKKKKEQQRWRKYTNRILPENWVLSKKESNGNSRTEN